MEVEACPVLKASWGLSLLFGKPARPEYFRSEEKEANLPVRSL